MSIDKYMKHYIDEEKAEMFDEIKKLIDKIGRMSCKTCIKIKRIIND